MSPPVAQRTLAGGEITPNAYARSDLSLYEKSARTLRNLICMRHGGVTGRPGSMYVGTALNGGAAVRLLPFIFNETGLGQSYVLEFGNQYVAFYQNGGVVISGGVPYVIASPYLQADLAALQFAESADVVTITHPNYPPAELKRLGATNWTLTNITFGPQQGPVVAGTVVGTAGGAVQQLYFVTAVSATGEESNATGLRSAGFTDPPSTAEPITITWVAVAGAVYYNVYYAPNNVGGFVGQASGITFVDTGITPDFTNNPPVANNVFSGAGNYPSTVGFVQQRRAFADTLNNPTGFWLSQPGDYYNFNVSTTPKDSDAVIATVAGEEVNSIQHIVELKFMLLLTAGAEIYVQGDGNGIVTPSSINASVQSQYGASALRPLKVGDVMIFNQALGSFVRDFTFDFAIDGYRGNDISIFASHLFEGYQIVDWAYQRVPDSIIWAVRSDGKLLSCTYVREQQVLAWTHHDFTDGFVENVCSIPENGAYSVYLSIRRVINGVTVRYIERLAQRLWTGPTAAVAAGTANSIGDPIDAAFCDCYSMYDGRNTGATSMTLTASGGFQEGTGTEYQQLLTLTSSVPYFGVGQTAQVGNQIFLEDALWVSSQGAKGNQVRLIIQSITSSTIAVVTPDTGEVPAEFQAVATTLWARAVQTVSGLDYLAGQDVSVWADRYVVGSPLNENYNTVYTVPVSGILTLDKPYSVIYVGLPMIQDLETLDLETYFGATLLGRRKRAAGLRAYLYNTRCFYAGGENPDTNQQNADGLSLYQLFPLKTGISQQSTDQPPPLITNQEYLLTTARWSKRGSLFIRNVDPVPLTILAISPMAEIAENTPYVRV